MNNAIFIVTRRRKPSVIPRDETQHLTRKRHYAAFAFIVQVRLLTNLVSVSIYRASHLLSTKYASPVVGECDVVEVKRLPGIPWVFIWKFVYEVGDYRIESDHVSRIFEIEIQNVWF